MISWSKCRPLKRSCAEVGSVIPAVIARYQAFQQFAPEPETLPSGAKQGINDFKRVGYGGPCPPPGKPHRYYFKLYALDAALLLKPRATKQGLLRAMDGHILAEARLSGTYQRKR